MAANNNGFADALRDINTLLKIDRDVELNVLEEAAKYFVEKLEGVIKTSNKNKKHLRDSLKVVVKENMVSVQFEKEAFYWYMVEHGHKKANGKGKVKGQHFIQNTFDAEAEIIMDIMSQRILD
jgi:hypothetical protein